MNGEVSESDKASIVSAVRSPMSFFALSVLICDAVISFAAASMGLTAFVYSMHLFLGLVGVFTIIALWSPKTLYHPYDVVGIDFKDTDEEKSKKLKITILILSLLVAYGVREYFKMQQSREELLQITEIVKSDIVFDSSAFFLKCKKQAQKVNSQEIKIICEKVYDVIKKEKDNF